MWTSSYFGFDINDNKTDYIRISLKIVHFNIDYIQNRMWIFKTYTVGSALYRYTFIR